MSKLVFPLEAVIYGDIAEVEALRAARERAQTILTVVIDEKGVWRGATTVPFERPVGDGVQSADKMFDLGPAEIDTVRAIVNPQIKAGAATLQARWEKKE